MSGPEETRTQDPGIRETEIVTRTSGEVQGTMLVPGSAQGPLLHLRGAINLWNGVDPSTGEIIDRDHPDSGRSIAGTILVIPEIKGATASVSVAESLRVGCGPAAMVLTEREITLVTASVVAGWLFDRQIPILYVDRADLANLSTDGLATLDAARLRVDAAGHTGIEAASHTGVEAGGEAGVEGADE